MPSRSGLHFAGHLPVMPLLVAIDRAYNVQAL